MRIRHATHDTRASLVNRRDFLLLKTDRGKQTLELSCERLYMCCLNTGATGGRQDYGCFAPVDNGEPPTALDERTTRRLFDNLDRVLRDVDILRVMDRERLSSEEFSLECDALMRSLRARGGRVEFAAAFAR